MSQKNLGSRREPFRVIYGERLWLGDVMAELRGDPDAINVALYLMTCPESCRTSIGVFQTGPGAMADAFGTSPERVRDALAKVCATGFALFDERHQMAWVREAARHQYGEEGPNPGANQDRGFLAILPSLLNVAPKSTIWPEFWKRYGAAWGKAWEYLGDALPAHVRGASERVQNASRTRPERVQNASDIERREKREEEDSPRRPPQGGGDDRPKRKTRKTIPADVAPEEVEKWLTIPDGLRGVAWFTRAKLAKRIRLCSKRKTREAWENELAILAEARETHGEDAAARLLKDATDSGWQGINTSMVQRIAQEVRNATPRGRRLTAREGAYERLDRENAEVRTPLPREEIDVTRRLAALAKALPENLPGRSELVGRILGLSGEVGEVEEALAALDRDFLAAAEAELSSEELEGLEAEILGSEAKLRSRMSGEQLADALGELREERLRKRVGLFELSLFAPEVGCG